MTKTKRNARGVALLELAMVLPFLLLLSMASIELGRAYYTYHILTKALRDGARYGASSRMRAVDGTFPTGESPSLYHRTTYMVMYGNPLPTGSVILPNLSISHITVTPSRVSSSEYYVAVSADYPYQPMFSLILPTTIMMRPSVKMLFVGQMIFT